MMQKLGPTMVVCFCLIALAAAGGWTYIFMTEQPDQLTKQGAKFAITIGVRLPQVWFLTAVGILVAAIVQRWRPHLAWWIACALFGAIGLIASLAGWVMYLGPAV
jgi:hypothetical protein